MLPAAAGAGASAGGGDDGPAAAREEHKDWRTAGDGASTASTGEGPPSALERAVGMDLRRLEDDDGDFAELALGDATVDRLLEGECLVEQLAESLGLEAASMLAGGSRRKKKRRTRTIELPNDNNGGDCDCGDDGDTTDGGNEPELEGDPCNSSSTGDEGSREDAEDGDDGADALFAEFGGADHDDEDSNNLDLRKRLRSNSVTSALSASAPPSSASAATLRVCRCGQMSRASLTSLSDPEMLDAGEGDTVSTALDLYSASREYLDLHIRYAVVIRVVDVDAQSRFVIRVEDAETQKRWEVLKTFREMQQFYVQVKQLTLDDAPVKKTLWGTFRGLRNYRLPKKFLHFRGALSQQRRVVFDSFLRQTAALVSPAPLGPRRRRAVLLLQEFVGVHRHCDVFDRGGCNCFFVKNQVNATQLVAEIFASPSHAVAKECDHFVAAMTANTRDDRHSFMAERKARAILRTVARKMNEIRHSMLKDELLVRELASARDEMGDSDYDDFLDEVRHAVSGFVQKSVYVPLEDHVYESLHAITSEGEENRLKGKIKILQTKPQSFFGIPTHVISSNDWEDARREMRRVNDYSLPLDKLKCIVRAAAAIFHSRLHQTRSGSSLTSVEDVEPSLTTDEFIPVNLFVLVMSNMGNLLLTRELLRLMCDFDDVTGEIGYYLTSFEVVVDLLERHENPHDPMLLS